VGKFKRDIVIIFLGIPLTALVLGLITAVLWPWLSNSFADSATTDSAKIETTRSKLVHIEDSLDFFKMDVGRYPTNSEGLSALARNATNIPNWNGPYYFTNSIGEPVDTWGLKFLYSFPPHFDRVEYDLYSTGPNRIDEHGLGDDIKAPLRPKVE
jgi:general secretion pathway protein G